MNYLRTPVEINNTDAASEAESPRSTFLTEITPLILIVLYVVILMFPFTVLGKALMPDTWQSIHPWARGVDVHENNTSIYDTVLEYGPWFEYSQECFREGRIPHWNPHQFCGAPLYANRLIPFFFPPFILAEIISSPERIIGWFQFFNFILSGWGMYFLLRRYRLARMISCAGAAFWLTCGANFLPFPLWTLGAIGFPWLLWALEGFLGKPGFRWIAISAFIMGLILMVGYPILVVHLTYFTAIYFIARWAMVRSRGPGKLHWAIPPAVLLAVIILGAGISMIANYPLVKYSFETERQVGGFRDQTFEIEKRRLITSPEEMGMDYHKARFGEQMDILLPINGRGTLRAWSYGGLLLYLLAIVGLFSGRRIAILLALIGAVFSIPLWNSHLYVFIMDLLPGWSITVLQPIEVVNMVVCILAAFGIEALTYKEWKPIFIARYGIPVICLASIVFTFVLFRDAPVTNLPILNLVAESNLFSYSVFHIVFFILFTIIALALGILLVLKKKSYEFRWGFILASLIFSMITFWYLQPVYSSRNYMPDEPLITEWAEQASVIDDRASGFRIARSWHDMPIPFNPSKRSKSPFIPNIQMRYGLYDVGGYDSLVPSRYINYCNHLFGEECFIEYRALIALRAPSIMYSRWLRAMGVKYIISQGELPEESRAGCTLVWDDRVDGNRDGLDTSDDFIQVWEVNNPLPRAFLTRRAAYVTGEFEDPLAHVVNWAVNDVELVVIEDPAGENFRAVFPNEFGLTGGMILDDSNVEFVRDEPEHLIITTNAYDECYLVLRDTYFSEWVATVDGSPATIYPADGTFRAVRLQPGTHTVEFQYVPTSFRIGLMITGISLVITLFIYILPLLLAGSKTLKRRPSARNW